MMASRLAEYEDHANINRLACCSSKRLCHLQTYVAGDASRSTELFAGANTIRVTPMTTSTADAIRNPPRWLAISSPSIDIATACAKLDHAAKAIKLRCADGFRTAMSKKIPSAT